MFQNIWSVGEVQGERLHGYVGKQIYVAYVPLGQKPFFLND